MSERESSGQPSAEALDADSELSLAKDLFNGTWTLLDKPDRTADEDAQMLHMAHASAHHWSRVGTLVNAARSEWQCSRVYATLNRGEAALWHAARSLHLCEQNGIADFDLAFAYEAMARASALTADQTASSRWRAKAEAACKDIADDEDREIVRQDLKSLPT